MKKSVIIKSKKLVKSRRAILLLTTLIPLLLARNLKLLLTTLIPLL